MEMARTGIVLNLIGVIIITLVTYYWGSWVFDIEPGIMPNWAVVE